METCEVGRKILVERLMQSRPSENATVFSKCTELSFMKHKATAEEKI